MAVVAQRVQTKASHVNFTATYIECGIGVQLKYPSRVDSGEQPPLIRNIDWNNSNSLPITIGAYRSR